MSSDDSAFAGVYTSSERATLERAHRLLVREAKRGELLTDPKVAGKLAAMKLRPLDHEEFAVMFLDNHHRLLAFECMFRGDRSGAEVHQSEVAKAALRHNATAVIIAHNHPSGNPEPSAADRACTARLKQALALIDVRLLDHFVIGDGEPVSLAEKGWV